MSLLVPPRRPSHEALDEPDLPSEEMSQSLEDLELVNRTLRSSRLLANRLLSFGEGSGAWRPTVLDVGAGSGGVARDLAAGLAQHGNLATVIALDLQWRHLASGRARSNGQPPLPSTAANVFSLPFPAHAVDWVVSTLLFHHFSPEQNVRLLRELARVARRGVLLLDLRRNRVPLFFLWLAGRVLFKTRISILDGVASIRQAYTLEEARAIVREALPGARVERALPFRLLITLDSRLPNSGPVP
jgi:SAM-dependent methyltransferase